MPSSVLNTTAAANPASWAFLTLISKLQLPRAIKAKGAGCDPCGWLVRGEQASRGSAAKSTPSTPPAGICGAVNQNTTTEALKFFSETLCSTAAAAANVMQKNFRKVSVCMYQAELEERSRRSSQGVEKTGGSVPKPASMSGKDLDSLLLVRSKTAAFPLSRRRVSRTRDRHAKEIITSLWLIILLTTPASTASVGMPQSDRQDRRAASRSLLAARSVHDPRLWIVMRLVLYQATRTTSPVVSHIRSLCLAAAAAHNPVCAQQIGVTSQNQTPREQGNAGAEDDASLPQKEIGNKTLAIYSLLPARTLRPSAAAQQHVDCVFSPPQTPPLPWRWQTAPLIDPNSN